MRALLSELLKLPGEEVEEEGGMASGITPVGRYALLQLLHVFSSLKLQVRVWLAVLASVACAFVCVSCFIASQQSLLWHLLLRAACSLSLCACMCAGALPCRHPSRRTTCAVRDVCG